MEEKVFLPRKEFHAKLRSRRLAFHSKRAGVHQAGFCQGTHQDLSKRLSH